MSRKPKVQTITANVTLTDRDADHFVISNAVDLTITLPPASARRAGITVTAIVRAVSVTTGLQIDPYAGDIIRGSGITALANKNIINSAATDAVGDAIKLVSDGAAGWWIVNTIGTWVREA